MSRDVKRRYCTLPLEAAGGRVDAVLAAQFPDYSRACLQRWIRQGRVSVQGVRPRARDKVAGGERIEITVPAEASSHDEAEAMRLAIVHEDDALLVVDKPAGLVVHPAAGNPVGTLLNGLLHHAPVLQAVKRAGIVHRLDRDTTGLLVVAKTPAAYEDLTSQLARRVIGREYLAVVQGEVIAGGSIEAPVGRHPVDRKRMAVTDTGKAATTHYRIEQRLRGHTLLRLRLESGRTHQIRVHLAHIRYPLVGDRIYGARPRPPAGAPADLIERLQHFSRQALHAQSLTLNHPASGGTMTWRAPLPADMAGLAQALKSDATGARV